jgi:hypothetical protein
LLQFLSCCFLGYLGVTPVLPLPRSPVLESG